MTENGMGRACGPYEEKRNAYSILLGNPDVRGHLDNIDGMLWKLKREWTGFVWRAVVNTVLNFILS
jgi:hypothetical protein